MISVCDRRVLEVGTTKSPRSAYPGGNGVPKAFLREQLGDLFVGDF